MTVRQKRPDGHAASWRPIFEKSQAVTTRQQAVGTHQQAVTTRASGRINRASRRVNGPSSEDEAVTTRQ